eukprot:9009488-Pyramimonas_sp.AAC.2
MCVESNRTSSRALTRRKNRRWTMTRPPSSWFVHGCASQNDCLDAHRVMLRELGYSCAVLGAVVSRFLW